MPPHRATRRRRRSRASISARSRRAAILVVFGLAIVITLVVAAFGSSTPSFQATIPAGSRAHLSTGRPLPMPVARQGDNLTIQIPVSQRDVTALGYRAAGQRVLALTPIGRQANEGLLSRVFHRIFGGGGRGITYYRLGGGDGPSTGALDVGAAAGTDVYAPVDGTVVSIRPYVIDGDESHYGHRIEIQPYSSPAVVVSVTHLRADPALTIGSTVKFSSTKIGTIVDVSLVEEQGLARYTKDAGNHVTVEVHPAASPPVS